MAYTWKALLLFTFLFNKGIANDCVPHKVDNVLVACVCNATYCDGIPEDRPEVPKLGRSYWYQSNKDGLRLKLSKVNFNDNRQNSSADVTLSIDRDNKYQKIFGFGGGFSDVAGRHILRLHPATQEQLMRAYFDPKTGSRYTLGRIPMDSVDSSDKHSTYDDTPNDIDLKHFAITSGDKRFKIPYARKAQMLNPETKFFATARSAPEWMKSDDGDLTFLKKEYYQTYANYIKKFLDGYAVEGIKMWAVETGNEPTNDYTVHNKNLTMAWKPEELANFIANNLGPTLKSSIHGNTKIMAFDDDSSTLSKSMSSIFLNEKSKQYTAGVSVHSYKVDKIDPMRTNSLLDQTHNLYPEKFILMTEACDEPAIRNNQKVISESWSRGEKYFLSIMELLNNWSIGWVDWNLVMDQTSGKNLANVHADAAIIVNPERDEFYKQTTYYAIKHFSRFVPRGSERISITDNDNDNDTIKSAAFLTPSNEIVVVVSNSADTARSVLLKDSPRGNLQVKLSPRSMNTFKFM